MFAGKVSSFHEVFKPLHVCSQIVGLTSFAISREHEFAMFEDRIKLHKVLILVLGFFMDITLLLIINFEHNSIWSAKDNPFVESKQVESGLHLLMSLFVSLMGATAIYTFSRRKSLVNCLNLITEVDNTAIFNTRRHKINLKKNKSRVLITIPIMYLILILSAVSHIYLREKYSISSFTNLFSFLINKSASLFFLIYFQFIFFILTIRSRYRYINSFLKTQMLGKACSPSFNNDLIEVAKIHDKLVDATNCMNEFYGLPVSWMMN